MTASAESYPSFTEKAEQLLRYAETYHRAALCLLAEASGGDAIARAPGRFCAVHAIELYLDAFLSALGESPARLRGHDLRMRAALAMERGLALRGKTRLHLIQLTLDREYLALRYGPNRADSVSELNRLAATLAEIARKVQEFQAGVPGASLSRNVAA